jgi:signal transduction histidine kinase/CheY-like chemotaxis protein
MRAIPIRTSGGRSAPLAIFAAAIMIVLVGIAVILQTDNSYRDARRDFARSQAQLLAVSVAAAVDFNDPVAAQEAVNPLRVVNSLRSAAVYGRDGRLIAGYDRSGETVPSAEETIPPVSSEVIRASVPVEMAGQRIGTAYVQLDRQPVWRRVSRYGTLGALVAAAALIVVALGFSQRALRNANRQLADRAEALSQSNELLEEQMEERAKAEDQLRQSQKMQALGQLTGGIAHDFNNLLTVIQGSADMLCKTELPEPKRKRFAQAIVQAAENAASLTSQLLAFARRQPLKPEQLDVSALIREMSELIDRTVGERITIATDLGSSGCTVKVDKAQLQSAILNIASNARDAMPDGGLLTIATHDVDGGPTGRMVALDIIDSGRGMDPETLDRVFEPFFTTKGLGKGTGLGLSQVYGFATQSGGDVRVASEEGRGTTLTLLLPCNDHEHSGGSEGDSTGRIAEQQAAAILVVEDNDEVGAFAETLLSELGHRVTLATSGEEALELCRANRFDVVFSDVVMPGMGGLKLAEILAAEKPELPVVLATGYSEEIAEAGSGGRPVILKPYRVATLSEVLAGALRGSGENGEGASS